MRIAVVGDTHGNADWLRNTIITVARQQDVDKIVQVGDFGFVWPNQNWDVKLRKVVAELGDMELYFLPGNHEDHTRLAELVKRRGVDENNHVKLYDNITYLNRYSAWTWGDLRFAAVGGAVSIDKDWRLREEPMYGHKLWWPREVLDGNEKRAAKQLGKVDVLFTHDSPTCIPMTLKQDPDSHGYRQFMDEVAQALQPRWWYHGHHHYRFVYTYTHEYGTTEVNGLDCDGAPHSLGMTYLDV